MKILIIGAGAIGAYLGAHLINRGHSVSYVARPQAASRLRQSGIILQDPRDGISGHISLQARVFSSYAEAQQQNSYSLIIAAVKTYDLPAVLGELKGHIGQQTVLMTPQNGLGSEERALDVVDGRRLLAASVTTPVSYCPEGSIRLERRGGLALAPVVHGRDIERWVRLFKTQNLDVVAVDDYQSMKWSKLLFNLMGNASAAILDWTPVEIYQDAQLFRLEAAMLAEALAVMRAAGAEPVDLPGAPTKRLTQVLRLLPTRLQRSVLVRAMRVGRGSKMPSFHIDLERGKSQSEVTAHNGMVATLAAQHGVAAPVNYALTHILSRLVSGELERESLCGRPQKLLQLVQQIEADYESAQAATANRSADVRARVH